MGPRKRVKTNPLETPASGIPLPSDLEAPVELEPPVAPRSGQDDADLEKRGTAEPENDGSDGVRI